MYGMVAGKKFFLCLASFYDYEYEHEIMHTTISLLSETRSLGDEFPLKIIECQGSISQRVRTSPKRHQKHIASLKLG